MKAHAAPLSAEDLCRAQHCCGLGMEVAKGHLEPQIITENERETETQGERQREIERVIDIKTGTILAGDHVE